MVTFKQKLQHFFCPLHIFCRFRDVGVPKKVARPFCKWYEVNIYQPIYKRYLKTV